MTGSLNPMNFRELGDAVEAARVQRGWTKEAAARKAGISSITWKRVEDGMNVHDVKRAAVLRVLGLDRDGQPSTDQASADEASTRSVGATPQDAPGYVESPGDRSDGGLSEAEVLRKLDQMQEDIRAMSEWVAKRQQDRSS